MMHLMEPPKPIEEQAKVSPAVAMIVDKALKKLPQAGAPPSGRRIYGAAAAGDSRRIARGG